MLDLRDIHLFLSDWVFQSPAALSLLALTSLGAIVFLSALWRRHLDRRRGGWSSQLQSLRRRARSGASAQELWWEVSKYAHRLARRDEPWAETSAHTGAEWKACLSKYCPSLNDEDLDRLAHAAARAHHKPPNDAIFRALKHWLLHSVSKNS